MKYTARHKVNIDGTIVDGGETVPGRVSEKRCEELVGRHLDRSEGEHGGSADVDVDLDSMTVADLEAFAKDLGLDLPDVNKADKLAFIKSAMEE